MKTTKFGRKTVTKMIKSQTKLKGNITDVESACLAAFDDIEEFEALLGRAKKIIEAQMLLLASYLVGVRPKDSVLTALEDREALQADIDKALTPRQAKE